MSKQYYLLSSLPELKLGDRPYFEESDFLEECRKWLSGKEMASLMKAKLGNVRISTKELPVVARWKQFDKDLRAELKELRRARKGKDKKRSGSLKGASSVFEKETPLEKERAFERLRWEMLSGMELEYFFDVSRLAIYYIKLQIALRMNVFDKEKGEKIFYDKCEVTYEKVTG